MPSKEDSKKETHWAHGSHLPESLFFSLSEPSFFLQLLNDETKRFVFLRNFRLFTAAERIKFQAKSMYTCGSRYLEWLYYSLENWIEISFYQIPCLFIALANWQSAMTFKEKVCNDPEGPRDDEQCGGLALLLVISQLAFLLKLVLSAYRASRLVIALMLYPVTRSLSLFSLSGTIGSSYYVLFVSFRFPVCLSGLVVCLASL